MRVYTMKNTTTTLPPSIATAWLLLSHAGFLSAAITASSIGYSFLTSNPLLPIANARGLGITWTAVGIAIEIFTIYAIACTWRENLKVKTPTFGSEGFFMLILIVLFLIAASIYTVVEVSISSS